MLLYHPKKREEVLVVEAKALIAPDEINEVHEANQAIVCAQDQVRSAINILTAMPIEVKQRQFKYVQWAAVRRLYGVVVTSDAEPHSMIDSSEIPSITYTSLRWRFRSQDYRSPERVWTTCIGRPWQSDEIQEHPSEYRDITVGDLTYRLPVAAVDINAEKLGVGKLNQLMTRGQKGGR